MPVWQLDSRSSPSSDGGPLSEHLTVSERDSRFQTNCSTATVTLLNTAPGQPLLSLLYPLCLLAVSLHACSQDNTHDRRPSYGHCWILRIQLVRPTLPQQWSSRDVTSNGLSGPRIPPLLKSCSHVNMPNPREEIGMAPGRCRVW